MEYPSGRSTRTDRSDDAVRHPSPRPAPRRRALAAPLAAALVAAAPSFARTAGPPDPAVPAIEARVPGTRWIAIVAEGPGEPRSTGSYALRVYADSEHGGRLDRFVAGLVRPRDGVVEAIRFVDLDRDGAIDVVVTLRTVGTGGYLAADAFRLRDGVPRLAASVEGLPRDEDPLPALAASMRTRAP
jgi:hypothetical protein